MNKPGMIVLGAVAALSLTAAKGGCGSSSTKKTSTATTVTVPATTVTPAAPTAPTAAPTTVAPTTAAPTTVAAPKVVFQQSGSGISTSESFGVKDEWQLAWTYNCLSFGGRGNFIVNIEQPPGKVGLGVIGHDSGVNQLGATGSGVEHYHYGGTIYLSMNSECSWTVKVTD